MTRDELIDSITCGTLPYAALHELISVSEFNKDDIQPVLLYSINQAGRLKREEWIMYANSVNYIDGSPINGDTVKAWLSGKFCLTNQELATFITYVKFDNGGGGSSTGEDLSGTMTLTGDGQITTFQYAHNLGFDPSIKGYSITPVGAPSEGIFAIGANATYFYIEYDIAPLGNLILNWATKA